MQTIEAQATAEKAIAPRDTLAAIVAQCEHALHDRLAKRFSTRDSLKALKTRAQTLLNREDGSGWEEDFEKLATTANAVFDTLVAEVGGAGNA